MLKLVVWQLGPIGGLGGSGVEHGFRLHPRTAAVESRSVAQDSRVTPMLPPSPALPKGAWLLSFLLQSSSSMRTWLKASAFAASAIVFFACHSKGGNAPDAGACPPISISTGSDAPRWFALDAVNM